MAAPLPTPVNRRSTDQHPAISEHLLLTAVSHALKHATAKACQETFPVQRPATATDETRERLGQAPVTGASFYPSWEAFYDAADDEGAELAAAAHAAWHAAFCTPADPCGHDTCDRLTPPMTPGVNDYQYPTDDNREV